MKKSTEIILQELAKRFPDKKEFRKSEVEDTALSLGYSGKDYGVLVSAEYRIRRGVFNLQALVEEYAPITAVTPVAQIPTQAMAMAPQSVVNTEKTYAEVDPTFVPWGAFSDVKKVIKSDMFYPVYISGLSGNFERPSNPPSMFVTSINPAFKSIWQAEADRAPDLHIKYMGVSCCASFVICLTKAGLID